MSASLERHPNVDDWIAVGDDGRVTVRTGKVEIGQHITTALALVAGEELDVDPSRVDVPEAETGLSPDEGYTSGSNSMEDSGSAVRLAAATARRHLLGLAARHLGADEAALEVSDGVVRVRGTNRCVAYGQLLGGAGFAIPVDPAVATKPPHAYRWMGRPLRPPRVADLVTGAAQFVHDMVVPGMLHARVVRPRHYWARLEGVDETRLAALADVAVVRDGSFLAVACADEHRANEAAARLAAAARWSPERGLEAGDPVARLAVNARESLPVVDGIPREAPVEPAEAPPAEAVATLRARYERPYQMHASLGPSAALAHHDGGRLTVWTHSQGIYPLRASIAEALGMAPARVRLVHAPGPGCYGHNGADDAALDAALVARALAGKPILLKWSRADEHAWEPYGSCMAVDLAASLDADGRVVAWSHETWSDTHTARARPGPEGVGPSRLLAMQHVADGVAPRPARPNTAFHGGIHRNADPLYAFPRRRVIKHLVRDLPLRTSALRSLGAYANVFAAESFMDELAAAARVDPLEFRLRHLADRRATEVLRAAAQRFGWEAFERRDGLGRGLAFARYKNTKAYAAVVVALEVDDAARVRLRRAVVAADAGQVVDADGLASQLEGGLLQAASWTLYEEVAFDEGGITSRDWETYPILGFEDVPEIETVVMDRPGKPYLGAGEAALGPTAAAIANAVHDATGLRIRRLPLRPDAIRTAALR